MATIKVRQNGSLLVEGDDVTLVDWNGSLVAAGYTGSGASLAPVLRAWDGTTRSSLPAPPILQAPLALATHTGAAVNSVRGAWIDEAGSVLIHSDRGIGVVHDQDLDPLLLASMIDVNGNVVEEEVFDELAELIEQQQPIPLWLRFRDSNARLEPIRTADVPRRFGFNPHPAPPSTTS